MSQKSKKQQYVSVRNHPKGAERFTVAHARRAVARGLAEWAGPPTHIRWLTIGQRVERAVIVPNVAALRAAGIPAVNVAREVKPFQVRWPAQLTVVEQVRLADGNLPDDPAALRSFARYPDKWSIAQMRRDRPKLGSAKIGLSPKLDSACA
jgi:hypothetical protein